MKVPCGKATPDEQRRPTDQGMTPTGWPCPRRTTQQARGTYGAAGSAPQKIGQTPIPRIGASHVTP